MVKTYVIRDRTEGLRKIGKSINPTKRLDQIKAGKNRFCESIYIEVVIEFDAEDFFHDMFSSKRVAGEWFNLSDLDVEVIKKTNESSVKIYEDENGWINRDFDGYYNATSLFKLAINHGIKRKPGDLNQYKCSKSVREFIGQLKSEGIDHPMKTSPGRFGSTWMHPKLFIDFAMWISPQFKSRAIDIMMSGQVRSESSLGSYYWEMCSVIMDVYMVKRNRRPPATIYQTEANRIKQLLAIEKDRNQLSKKELDHITTLQKLNATMITKGMGVTTRINHLQLTAESLTGKKVEVIL